MRYTTSLAAAPAMNADFASAARRVRTRVMLRRWLALLERTLWPVCGLLLVMTALAWRGGYGLIALIAGAWLLWKAATLLVTWLRRPGEYSALALWDAATGRREAFANAWWFESRAEISEGERLHVAAQKAALPDALPALAKDLPLRPSRALLVPVAIAALGCLISAVRAPKIEVTRVDDEMAAQAAKAAADLRENRLDAKKLTGLTEDEKKQVEELNAQVEQNAAELAEAAGKDAREVLANLERSAREAEKMAEELGSEKDVWASDKLVEQLRQHADTADLGDAVAAKNSAEAAKEAAQLAQTLQTPNLPAETRQRLAQTLEDTRRESEDSDRQRVVGQHVLGAADQMQKGDSKNAGAEFQKLADKLQEQQLREQARDELKKLAEQLREAGGAMSGENGAMQQLGQEGQNGPQSPNAGENGAPQVGQTQPQSQPQQNLAPPGLGQQNQMQSPGAQPPGTTNNGAQQPQMMQMSPQTQNPSEQGQQPNGQPMLFAPIPGAPPPKADPKGPMLIAPGENPNPDGGMAIQAPSNGPKPGVGKAELNAAPTERSSAEQTSVVQAQQNAEGQSTSRTVQGGERTEQSTARSASAMTLEAIQAEETALDESALPPARRAQVRRYFNELRKRFEGGK